MSADNFLLVRLRPDGRFGVSHRFASCYYDDDSDLHSVDVSFIGPAPPDFIIRDTAEEAVMEAHREEARMDVLEYGVCIGEGVLNGVHS